MKKIQHESILQQSCIKWFDYQYPKLKQLLFAIPNGGGRSAVTAQILKGEGVRSGVCDLFLTIPKNQYHGFYIEMKYGKNKPEANQVNFIDHVRSLGYKAEVIYTFDKFKEEVELYLS
jgi:hypothetical protein